MLFAQEKKKSSSSFAVDSLTISQLLAKSMIGLMRMMIVAEGIGKVVLALALDQPVNVGGSVLAH